MTDPKHISKLDKMQAARFQQDMQDILLAIVAQQGKTIRIPLELAQATAENNRLKFVRDTDPETGAVFIELSVERAPGKLINKPARLMQ
jgi:hypothetical protein